MNLFEIFNKLHQQDNNIPQHYVKQISVNNNIVKVDIELIDTNVAVVDFFVNDNQKITGTTSIQDTIKIFQFVISCLANYNNNFPNVEFCFGADKEHEMVYDKILPRLAPKYNMIFKKHHIVPDKLSIKDKLLSKFKKRNNSVKLSCLYYMKRDQRDQRVS